MFDAFTDGAQLSLLCLLLMSAEHIIGYDTIREPNV